MPMPGSSSTVTTACLHSLGDGGDPFAVVVRAKAVVEGRAGDAVAVADLDGVDFGAVERAGDLAHRLQMYW